MEVHRQRCQQCGSIDVRNILVREDEVPAVIYVRCSQCGQLVARYKLIEYYHHGKGVDSFIRSIGAAAAESGRDVLNQFNQSQAESIDGYEQALKYLQERDKPV
jgi:hypothetical protein